MDSTFSRSRGPLRGRIRVPGDKSISHRAVLFSAMAEGVSRLEGVLDSADVRSTMDAVSELGAHVALERQADGILAGKVSGWGAAGPRQPSDAVDCGNSGTTARLLMGVLAAWPIEVTLTGDPSLSKRPMARVTEPLSMMGAAFAATAEETLPITVRGTDALDAVNYASAVASAQVKSAILLAGTQAAGTTTVREPVLSRDHTERLLPAFGVPVEVLPGPPPGATVTGPSALKATSVRVPGDPSSAAFIAVAAAMVPGSEVTIEGVSLNPTRTGFLEVLKDMGVPVDVEEGPDQGSEPSGDVTVSYAEKIGPARVSSEQVPALIDELPILALLASRAAGTSRFEGIGELRVKESDRLSAITGGLGALGVPVRSGADWLEVDGPFDLRAATQDSRHDHRLAMTWAVAGLAGQGATVMHAECVDVSYPGFSETLASLGA